MSDQIAMLNGMGKVSRRRRKGQRRARRNRSLGYHRPMHYAGLGADGSGGGTTMLLLGLIAVGAFVLLRKKDSAPMASPSALRNNAALTRAQYTKSLYE